LKSYLILKTVLVLILIALMLVGCGSEQSDGTFFFRLLSSSAAFQKSAEPEPTSTPIPLPTLQSLVNQFENTEPNGPIYSIAWSPDGTDLALGSGKYDAPHDNGTLIIWNVPIIGN